jgi:hypothetical protein
LKKGFVLEHGVGISVQRFFAPSAPDFWRTALKVRLASVEIPIRASWKLVISHNWRIYADQVRGIDFTPGPKPENPPSEKQWRWGVFSIGVYPG